MKLFVNNLPYLIILIIIVIMFIFMYKSNYNDNVNKYNNDNNDNNSINSNNSNNIIIEHFSSNDLSDEFITKSQSLFRGDNDVKEITITKDVPILIPNAPVIPGLITKSIGYNATDIKEIFPDAIKVRDGNEYVNPYYLSGIVAIQLKNIIKNSNKFKEELKKTQEDIESITN